MSTTPAAKKPATRKPAAKKVAQVKVDVEPVESVSPEAPVYTVDEDGTFEFPVNDPFNEVTTTGTFRFKIATKTPYFRRALRVHRDFLNGSDDLSDEMDAADGMFAFIETIYAGDETMLAASDLVSDEDLPDWFALVMGSAGAALPKDHLS